MFSYSDMEDQQRYSHYAICASCRRTENRKRTISSSSRIVLFTIALSVYVQAASTLETLCGGELVDALQFVCGDRGFYFSRPNRSNSRRAQRGIVEECCFRGCDLNLMEQYCAKPVKSERDVSATSLQVIPMLHTLQKDLSRRPSTVKHSRYVVCQRKAAQRLRRGVPAFLRTRKFRRQAEKILSQEQGDSHRPLIPLPNRRPPFLSHSTTQTHRK
ncbi:insulin-like growth factor 2a [Chanos chanos]|uniref:Insulin-like growth factor 2 n=1 Tax=Chanos chanos TaxID=29144 RepID=A0A6J2UPX5_CHACN|nr:insulin-like growth factor II [Chanos chanos]